MLIARLFRLLLSISAVFLMALLHARSDAGSFRTPDTAADESIGNIEWEQRASYAFPDARLVPGMAYDSDENVTVLFGGHGDRVGSVHGDTWKWDGNTWTQLFPPVSPSPRYQHKLVYDNVRGVFVTFGGLGPGWGQLLGDTWEFDGTTWTERLPASRPSARDKYVMAYDTARQRVVLFGGRLSDSNVSNETWEYDGNTWIRVFPEHAPSARQLAAMVYDGDSERLVLFGGFIGELVPLDDTWEYDGIDWTQRYPDNKPTARWGHELMYDSSRNRIVLFGGYDENDYFDDAWEWDGNNWEELRSINPPPARAYHAMVYDSERIVGVLLGGRSDGYFARNDTWECRMTNRVYLPIVIRWRSTVPLRFNAAMNPVHLCNGSATHYIMREKTSAARLTEGHSDQMGSGIILSTFHTAPPGQERCSCVHTEEANQQANLKAAGPLVANPPLRWSADSATSTPIFSEGGQ